MKALYILPLLLILSGCKYDSLSKIIQAADLKVIENGSSDSQSSCLEKQIAILDDQLASLNKKQRTAVEALVKDKLDTIEFDSDKMTKTSQGLRSVLYHVVRECNSNGGCWYVEDAQRTLKDDTTNAGTDPEMKIEMKGKTLSMQSEYSEDLTVEKKYYTQSVASFANTTTLDEAISDSTIWNQPNPGRDSANCAKPISLNDLLAILNHSDVVNPGGPMQPAVPHK